MRILSIAAACTLTLVASGCVEVVSEPRLQQYQSTIRASYFEQVNRQLAISLDNPYAIPVFINYSSATLAGSAAFSVGPSRTFAPTGVTSVVGLTAGPMSSTSTLAATTFNLPKGLQVSRDLFAYTVGNFEMGEQEKRSLMFLPPDFGWLRHSSIGSKPPECQTGGCYFIGNAGKYALYTTSQKSYSDFVILVYQALQLQEQTTVSSGSSGKPTKPTSNLRPRSRNYGAKPSSIIVDPGSPPATAAPQVTIPATQ